MILASPEPKWHCGSLPLRTWVSSQEQGQLPNHSVLRSAHTQGARAPLSSLSPAQGFPVISAKEPNLFLFSWQMLFSVVYSKEDSTASFLCFAFHQWRGKNISHPGAPWGLSQRSLQVCVATISCFPPWQPAPGQHTGTCMHWQVERSPVTQLDKLVSRHTSMPSRTRAVPVGYSPGCSENQHWVNWVLFLLLTLLLCDLRRVTLLLWASFPHFKQRADCGSPLSAMK